MRRERKIRAWDEKIQRMFYVDLYEYMSWNEGAQDEALSADAIENGLMDFTGRKDRNGKEIWEGDIVEWIDQKGRKQKGRVDYLGFSYSAMMETGSGHGMFKASNYKVIGNVFENPELLSK